MEYRAWLIGILAGVAAVAPMALVVGMRLRKQGSGATTPERSEEESDG